MKTGKKYKQQLQNMRINEFVLSSVKTTWWKILLCNIYEDLSRAFPS